MRSAVAATILASTALAAWTGCSSSTPPRRLSGRALFEADCSHCHSLAGRESPARQGGDLLGYRLGRSELGEFIREMPLRRPVSRAQLAALVGYVLGAQRSSRGQ
jgi:mono/diheme cytochrome c family protein